MAEPLTEIPCQSWANATTQWCCPEANLPTVDPCPPNDPAAAAAGPWTQQQLLDVASSMLYVATGYRFPGICEDVVEWDALCECPVKNCRCCATRQALPGPPGLIFPITEVVSIEEIDSAGNATTVNLSAGKIAVLDYNHITRDDGEVWFPKERDVCRLRVRFKWGRTPPPGADIAAAKLACILAHVCVPDACNGSSVTGFTAAGRTYDLASIRQELLDGRIPEPTVLLFLSQYGAKPHVGRVWSPDLARRTPSTVTWQAP